MHVDSNAHVRLRTVAHWTQRVETVHIYRQASQVKRMARRRRNTFATRAANWRVLGRRAARHVWHWLRRRACRRRRLRHRLRWRRSRSRSGPSRCGSAHDWRSLRSVRDRHRTGGRRWCLRHMCGPCTCIRLAGESAMRRRRTLCVESAVHVGRTVRGLRAVRWLRTILAASAMHWNVGHLFSRIARSRRFRRGARVLHLVDQLMEHGSNSGSPCLSIRCSDMKGMLI